MKRLLYFSFVLCAACSMKFGTVTKPIEHNVLYKENITRFIDANEINDKEKQALVFSIVGHSVDLVSSMTDGSQCVEQNFILGKDPALSALIGLNLAAIAFEVWLYANPKIHGDTHYFGYTSFAFHTVTGISNWIECPR